MVTITLQTIAKPVNTTDASKVAENFYMRNSLVKLANAVLTYTGTSADGSATYYVFNINNNDGFVIIAADDVVSPVIGYSTTGSFRVPAASSNIYYWLADRAKQINKAKTINIQFNKNITNQWSFYLNDNKTEKTIQLHKSVAPVAPLVKTLWDQEPYYNALCPHNSVTGCVATAMAQVMRYWNFPAHGTDSSSYCDCTVAGFTNNYGTLSANYGATTFHWNNMPLSISSSSNDVDTLMYLCGVSIDMDYDPNGSGANVIAVDGPASAQISYPKYFGYDPFSIKGILQSNYTITAWDSILDNELVSGRPVHYAGGDHSWVLDGCDSNNLFHMNWGWSGYDDGYFSLSNIVADGDNLTSYQEAIVGIRPFVPVSNDAGITNISAPSGTSCLTTIQPQITLKNWGADTLTSCLIHYIIDSGVGQTYNWIGSLASLKSTNISIPSIYVGAGYHTLTCFSAFPNGVADGDTINDKSQITFYIQSGVSSLPFSEGFESTSALPSGWSVYNPDNDATWEVDTAVAYSGSHCIAFNNYDGDGNNSMTGNIDRIYLPAVNFTLPTEYLSFDVAYAPVSLSGYLYTDTLAVYYSTDCGTTWHIVYSKGGATLETAATVSSNWAPASSSQWRIENVNLSLLTGQSDVLIAFENRSDWANWIYIDNINISANPMGITSHDEISENVKVFPNPSHEMLNVECTDFIPETLTILNSQGEKIIDKKVNSSKIEVNIHSLSAGIYFIKIYGNEKTCYKKLVVD